jgi:hypothetical protein
VVCEKLDTCFGLREKGEREGRERVRESEKVRVRDPLVQIKKHASSGGSSDNRVNSVKQS